MSGYQVDSLLKPLQIRDLRALCRSRNLNPAGEKDELFVRVKQYMMATGDTSIDDLPGGASIAAAAAQQAENGYQANVYQRSGMGGNVGNFMTDRHMTRVLAPPGGVSHISFGGDPGPARSPARSQGGDSLDGLLAQQAQAPPPGYGYRPATGMAPGYQPRPPTGMAGGYDGGGFQRPPPTSVNNGYDRPPQNMSSPAYNPYGGQSSSGYGGGYGQQYGSPYSMYHPSGMPSNNGYGNNYARPGGAQNVGNFLTDRPTSRVLAPPGGRTSVVLG